MIWRLSLAVSMMAVIAHRAEAQTRVAIPRAALSSPGQASASPAATSGETSQWRTTPLAQVADNGASATPPGVNATSAPGQSTTPQKPVAAVPPAATAPPATSQPGGAGAVQPIEPLKEIRNPPKRHQAPVSQSSAVLPNEAGQVWREYDIAPYTVRVSSTNRPEQAIIDWILRETGYETWHSEPLGILSATSKVLRVYHTPEVQAVVADVVDRFVSSEAESQAFGLNVVTIANPNWRINAQRFMQPVAVQTQGIQAWLMRREDAALVLAELRRRGDFREHSAPQMLIANGQSGAVNVTQPRQYVRNVLPRQTQAGLVYENETASFDEGFGLELSPLMGLDGRTVDAVLKCQIDQLERLVPVMLDAPSPLQPRQRQKIEIPQATHFRLHERFRWPVDQVLVVGLGMVAPPTPQEPNALVASLPLVASPPRADLLVFVEGRGKVATAVHSAPAAATPPAATAGRFGGRY